MKLPEGMGKYKAHPDDEDKEVKRARPAKLKMSLEEWEETPPELRRKIADPYYEEEVEEDHGYIDEEWDGGSPETSYITGDALEDEKLKDKLRLINSLNKALYSKEAILDPSKFGLPDLMRKQTSAETDEEFYAWRKKEMLEFVEGRMYAFKEGKQIEIKLVPKMLDAIHDVFYGITPRVIWWKSRGGGGSLCAAIVIWLLMVYQQRDIINMAGSGGQAGNVYTYVKYFWDCFPKLSKALLTDAPLMKRTNLHTGAGLECITSSEMAGRGKHKSVIVVDEACQGIEKAEKSMESAISGTLSEDDAIVIMLSTFHHPIGLFQEYWDLAEEKGFAQHKWDIFDIMSPCRQGMECATKEDPQALKYCETKCPFSWEFEKRSPDGTLEEIQKQGCWGKARNSTGFMSYDKVVSAQKIHQGTNVFKIEFACERPSFNASIWNSELIDPVKVKPEDMILPPHGQYEVAVGVDWGFEGQTAIVVCIWTGQVIYVIESHFMTGKSVDEVMATLVDINGTYGDFEVFADESHPFNNASLEDYGFCVNRVNFRVWKEIGISNITRFLISHKVRINKDMTTFLEQVKMYHRSKTGKPVKKQDHACDAWTACMLGFIFPELFPDLDIGDPILMEKIRLLRGVEDKKDESVLILGGMKRKPRR